MRKTTVKSLSVGGKAKIYHSGDTVYENNFPKGNFDKLIKSGHLNDPEEVEQGENVPYESEEEPELDDRNERQAGEIKFESLAGTVIPGTNRVIPNTPQSPLEKEASAKADELREKRQEKPVVPGTPSDEHAKPKTLKAEEVEEASKIAEPEVGNVTATETEGEKKGTLKDQGYLDAQKSTAQKIEEVVKDAESKQMASTDFKDVDKDNEGTDPNALTVAQLKKELDARGVEYPANAKKEDLVKLWIRG